MPRKTKADAIYLTKTGIFVLFACLGLMFAVLLGRLFIPKSEIQEEIFTLNIEAERDPGAADFLVVSRTSTPPGGKAGGLLEISVPCDIKRQPLIATIREALVVMHASHPDHTCHRVNVYLDSLLPPDFSPIVEAQFCIRGRVEDNVQLPPWTFHIRLIPETEWEKWGFDEEKIQSLCRKLAKAGYCPWERGEHDSKAVGQVAKSLGVSNAEAATIIRQGQNLVSDNYNYRRNIR